MLQAIKNFLKRIFPPPVRTFLREMEELRRLLREQNEQMRKLFQENMVLQQRLLQENAVLKQQLVQGNENLKEQLTQGNEGVKQQFALQGETLKHLGEQMMDHIARERKMLSGEVNRVEMQAALGSRYASEAVWAEIFNNTIYDSPWLKDQTFSPGRWAVGYQYLYVMYRVLNEQRPKKILELGLGQSTRMIAQYAKWETGVEHDVVEHDSEWMTFFEKNFDLPESTRMVQLDREMVPYKEAEAVRVFKGFSDAFEGRRFDFISIDAPLGGDMKQYSRIDVLQMLPQCISENFVIMIDDAERSGEMRTAAAMEARLTECGVAFRSGRYSGKKDCVLICAEHLGFLTTM